MDVAAIVSTAAESVLSVDIDIRSAACSRGVPSDIQYPRRPRRADADVAALKSCGVVVGGTGLCVGVYPVRAVLRAHGTGDNIESDRLGGGVIRAGNRRACYT